MDRRAECKVFAHFLASGNQYPGRRAIRDSCDEQFESTQAGLSVPHCELFGGRLP